MKNLRVKPLSSLGAKLFYVTTILVTSTVAALSWKNGEMFRDQLNHQFQRVAIDSSENAGNVIETMLNNWESQLKVVLQSSLGQEPAQMIAQLDGFLSTDDDFVAVHILKQSRTGGFEEVAYRFTKRIGTAFENVALEPLASNIQTSTEKWLGERSKTESERELFVRGLYRTQKLPLMNLARGFKVKGSDDRYWAVLTAWQAPLIASLKSSRNVSSVIIDQQAFVFASKDLEEMGSTKSLKDLELVKMSKDGLIRTGYRGGYRDGAGKEWLGAYYRINKYDLVVLVQQDAASAYAAIRKLVEETVKWGAFFVLLAVFFSYFGSNSVTRNLRALTIATQRIAGGDFRSFVKPTTRDEVGLLSVSVNVMAHQIQELLQAQVKKARFEKELETAQAVQNTLFPKKDRKKRGICDVSGFSTPATECGGDWWGHYVSEDGTEYVFIADAMGHGVPAALVTAMAYSSCMTIISMIRESNRVERTPKRILERFNRVLYDAVEGTISMTFFALEIDHREGRMTYANAGHNFPVLVPANTEDERIGKKNKALQKISPLSPISLNKVNGSILGVDPQAKFEQESMPLRGGDKLVLFTDGIIENTNAKNEAWGRKVFLEKILSHIGKDAEGLRAAIIQDVATHLGKHPLADDMTLVTIHYPTDAKPLAPTIDLFDVDDEDEEGSKAS